MLDELARVQLPAPPPSAEPLSALWKSPKSPKDSNDASSRCSGSSADADANVNGSLPLAAAASENGPKVSCRIGVSERRRVSICRGRTSSNGSSKGPLFEDCPLGGVNES